MIKLALLLLVLCVFLAAGGIYVILFCIGLVLVILQYTAYFFIFLYIAIEDLIHILYIAIRDRIPTNKRKTLAQQAKEKRVTKQAKEKRVAKQDERQAEHRKIDRLAKAKKFESRAQNRELDRLAKEKRVAKQDERQAN